MRVSLSVNELYVDDPDKDSGGKIDVSLNISLPNLHCDRECSQQPSPQQDTAPLYPTPHPRVGRAGVHDGAGSRDQLDQ